MLMRTLAVVPVALLLMLSTSFAIDQPRIVPHSGRVDRPIEQVYSSLKAYFSDPTLSFFTLQSAQQAKGSDTLAAHRSGIDHATWNQWTACQGEAQQMIYQFSDGSVTVNVKLEPSGNQATFVTVTSDFQGTYELAGQSTTIACMSKGGLEDSILSIAGGGSRPQAKP